VRSIGKLLNLGDSESAALLELAERETDQSHDLFQFTSMINQGYSAAEKERLVEHLWRVARADETIHKYEEHLIRRIAFLKAVMVVSSDATNELAVITEARKEAKRWNAVKYLGIVGAAAVIVYFTASVVRGRQGMSLAKATAEIPPE